MASDTNISDITKACSFLKSMVDKGFGPNALNTMLVTDTGKIIITSEGAAVMNSIHLSHPLGSMITEAVSQFHISVGDQSKSFIILLGAIFSMLTEAESPKEKYRQRLIVCFPKLMHTLRMCTTEVLSSKVYAVCVTEDNHAEVLKSASKIVLLALQGKLHVKSMEHVASVVVDLVFRSDGNIQNFHNTVYNLISNYTAYSIECSGLSVQSTSVINGVIIERDFYHETQNITSDKISFVLIDCDIQQDFDSKVMYKVQSHEALRKAFLSSIDMITTLVDHLVRNKVNLVLISGKAGELLLQQCKQTGLSLVQYVPNENLSRLAFYSGINIAHSIGDCLKDKQIFGHAEKCSKMILNRRQCILLQNFKANRRNSAGLLEEPYQLLVCAPSPGMCQHVSLCIRNTLKVLQMWLQDDKIQTKPCMLKQDDIALSNTGYNAFTCSGGSHPHGISILGGGAFEIALSNAIMKCTELDNQLDISTSHFLEIIGRALLTIPVQLLKNSYSPNANKCTVLDLNKLLKNADDSSSEVCYGRKYSAHSLFGIEAKSGTSIINGLEVLEPVASKIFLLESVLYSVRKLLQIDKLVSISKVPVTHDSVSDDEN